MKKALFIFIMFSSCIKRVECTIEPISSEILDEKFWSRNIIFSNGNERDTLLFVSKIDILTDTSIKAITNYEECGHLVEFDYKFSSSNKPLEIRIEKKENEKYIFSLKEDCITQALHLNQSSIKDEIILRPLNCNFIEIGFNNMKFDYYRTKDGRIWRAVF